MWDARLLSLASLVASWSRDPSTKVGCVIVRPNNTIASVGFNGFPRGVNDDEELYANRDIKLARTIHAEENAVLNAAESVDGYTAYVTAPPCMHCTAVLIQAGITTVKFLEPSTDLKARWGDQFAYSEAFFAEAGVEYTEIKDVG